jgi:hypothetical protein
LKLRPDIATLFPEIRDLEPSLAQDGQRVLQVDVERQLGLRRALCCEPCAVVFLERQGASTNNLIRMSAADAAMRLRQDLLPEAREAAQRQWEAIDRLVGHGCWLLRYGGTPQSTAAAPVRLLDAGLESQTGVARVPTRIAPPRETVPPDPFRPLTPTPHVVELPLMGRTVRLETNAPAVLKRAERLFAP